MCNFSIIFVGLMKICLVGIVTPTSENIRGTSALPYHLMAERGDGIDIDVYTFNNNGISDVKIHAVEDELKVRITKVPLPRWYQWLFYFHLLFLRVFLKYPFLNYVKLPQRYVDRIRSCHPDLIWVMGEELSRIIKQFPQYRRIQLGPDTESLYYYRMMGQRFVMKSAIDYWKSALMYRKYARMEREFPTDDNYTYCAVGEEDIRHLQQLNPKVNAKFLRHPHYSLSLTLPKREGRFHQPKIKVLIAGQYNLYMRQTADELFEELKNSKIKELKNCYSYTFLGKGWERHVETLKGAGYEVEHIEYAPDYIEEIVKHDIQITPIAIGTGTKGKVLDALANGLLVVGTPYALENIAVKHGVSCIEYREPQEVIEALMDIPNNIRKYEMMAAEGRKQVLKHHSRAKVASELFSLNCQ